MTLAIHVEYIDENGDKQRADLGLGGHLAGVEVARQELWGAPIMIELGLKILPTLATRDIRVQSEDELNQLKQEALTIQENLPIILENVRFGEETIIGRTNNFIKAVEIAQKLNGTITIG